MQYNSALNLEKNPVRWKLDLLLSPRNQKTEFPGKHDGSSRPKRPDRANPPTNFDDPLFDSTGMIYMHWTDSQQGILCWGFKGVQLQQQSEYTLLKPDCHSWAISKMQSGHEEEWNAIKFCLKLGKMPQKRMECFRLLLDHLAWIEHHF